MADGPKKINVTMSGESVPDQNLAPASHTPPMSTAEVSPKTSTLPTNTEQLDPVMAEALSAIEISEDGKLSNVGEQQKDANNASVSTAPPSAVQTNPGNVPPPAPGDVNENIPKFGSLQPKVDSHPLFSGAAESAPKIPRGRGLKKTLLPLLSLLIIASALFLAVDSGAIRGASHLPFHILKQPSVAVQPVISKTTTPVNPYAGWASYSNAYGSFKYPANWTVDNSQEATGKFVDIIGPTDSKIGLVDKSTGKIATTYTGNHIQATIFFTPSQQQKNCMGAGEAADTCTVYDATDLAVSKASAAKLIISDFTTTNYPNYITLTDDPLATLNAKTFTNGVIINNKFIVISAMVMYKSPASPEYSSYGPILSAKEFKTTNSYKELKNIVESVLIK